MDKYTLFQIPLFRVSYLYDYSATLLAQNLGASLYVVEWQYINLAMDCHV